MKRDRTKTKTLKPDNCIGEVVFNTWDCYVLIDKYLADGSYVIRLIDATDSLPIATCTICTPRPPYFRSEDVVIKDYSENAGILDCLIDAGIVSPPLEVLFISGYVTAPVCKLLVSIPTAKKNKKSVSSSITASIEASVLADATKKELEPKKELTLEPKTISENHTRKRKERRKSLNPHSVWKG